MQHTTSLRLFGASFLFFSSAAASQLPVLNADLGPQGASVGTPVGNQLTINQTMDRAIVNWESFSIDEGYSVHFNQGSDQAILNRVTGNGASELHGELTAGGTVWLINPNGLLIGSTGRIETRSFIASTLNVSDSQFLENAATFNLEGDSTATIHNLGNITATGGDVILVARQVTNSNGIEAADGLVGLAAGNNVEITLRDTSSSIVVQTAVEGVADGDGVTHAGLIEAARAELVAAGGNIYGMAVNVSGDITAAGAPDVAPSIRLASEGGSIAVSGKLVASSASETDAGRIELNADRAEIRTGALLDVSGESAGGTITLSSAADTPMSELDIAGSAALRANGENGNIRLAATHMVVAGELQSLGSANTIYLSQAESVDAADARIEGHALVLENVFAGNLSNAGNAFERLMLTGWAGEAVPDRGDLSVNAGRGSLAVVGEGQVG